MTDPSILCQSQRTCASCGQLKDLAVFPIVSARTETQVRRGPRCKQCKAQRERERRGKNRQQMAALGTRLNKNHVVWNGDCKDRIALELNCVIDVDRFQTGLQGILKLICDQIVGD